MMERDITQGDVPDVKVSRRLRAGRIIADVQLPCVTGSSVFVVPGVRGAAEAEFQDRSTLPYPTSDAFTRAAGYLDAIADSARLQILWHLIPGEQTLTGLCRLVGEDRQLVSRHLAALELRQLVTVRRRQWGQYYCLSGPGHDTIAMASKLLHQEEGRGAEPGRIAGPT